MLNNIPNDTSCDFFFLEQLEDRAREAISERNALAAAFSSGVTEDGLKLFLNLSKTIGRDVTWKGQDIIVNSIVLIKPPYKTDNCCLATESARNDKMISYVQQLVSRFWTDAVKQSSSNRPSPEKQTSSSSSSTVVSGQTTTTQNTVVPAATATTVPTAASIVAGTAKTSNGSGQQQQQENNSKGMTKTSSQGKKGSRNGA